MANVLRMPYFCGTQLLVNHLAILDAPCHTVPVIWVAGRPPGEMCERGPMYDCAANGTRKATINELVALTSSSIRLEMISVLASNKVDVTSLANIVDLSVASVSYHLKKIREAGVANVEKSGKRRLYALAQSVQLISTDGSLAIKMPAGDGSFVTVELPNGHVLADHSNGGSSRTGVQLDDQPADDHGP